MLLTILLLVLTTHYTQAQFEKYNQSSGYVDVRQGAHMFYWLFYTTAPVKNYTERPLIICMFGDPGTGVTGLGNFWNLGPLLEDLSERNYTLIKDFNLLFLDSPVGSGFSYVDNPKLLTKTTTEIATDSTAFIAKFFETNPEFQNVPLYIYGQGYGARTAVEVAIKLKDAEKKGTVKSKFLGIFMENPWVSPMDHVHAYPRMLKSTALVEQDGYDKVLNAVNALERLLKSGQYDSSWKQHKKTLDTINKAATAINFDNIFFGTPTNLPNTVYDPTPEVVNNGYETVEQLEKVMNSVVKPMLKTPKKIVWKYRSDAVYNAHSGDFMKPTVDSVEKLLNVTDVSVTILNGNYDLIGSTPGQTAWISRLNWPGAQIYNKTFRRPFWENNRLQGYYKIKDNFGFYAVNGAGRNVNNDNANPDALRYILRAVTTYG